MLDYIIFNAGFLGSCSRLGEFIGLEEAREVATGRERRGRREGRQSECSKRLGGE